MTGRPLRRGDDVELRVDRAAFGGRSVGRWGELVVFVDGAVPGDRVRASVTRKKKQYVEARVEEVLEPSPHRVEPACPHFGPCGGCRWQHLHYREQLRWKRAHVLEAYERIGGFRDLPVCETLPAVSPFYYRNKMEFSFGETRWLMPEELGRVPRDAELFALGLHVPGRYDRILHVDDCRLQSPTSNAILAASRAFFLDSGVPAYSTRTHTGDLRHLVIREGKHTGERMVFLVSSHRNEATMRAYAALLSQQEFGVTTFVHGITRRKSTVAIGDEEIVYFGSGRIRERLGKNVFSISPTSFFQTNTLQAERLYEKAAEYAELEVRDRVWDLYCGTGAITLFVAGQVSAVTGVELSPAPIADARRNAAENGIGNADFVCADLVDYLGPRAATEWPDVVIVDPPRAGMHRKVVEALGASGIGRLVYVSCNPTTSARDCALLAARGYAIEEIAPVDMFPHTQHIECVVKLRRRA